jgi:hypothetical protein
LTRLAACIDSRAQIASVHRRLERFFSDVRLNEAQGHSIQNYRC